MPPIPLLLLSLLVAGLGFLEPFLFMKEPHSVLPSFGFSGLWMLLFIFGLMAYRKRGLWLLLGAPFALIWPAMLGLFISGCAFGFDCP